MCTNLVIAGAVSTFEGLASGIISNYKSNDKTEELLGERKQNKLYEFKTPFCSTAEIKFDDSDCVYEEFVASERQRRNIDVNGDEGYNFDWMNYRPPAMIWFSVCAKINFYLILMSTIVGIFGCICMFIDINTADVCCCSLISVIPKPIRQIKIICQSFEAHMSQLYHIIMLSLVFGSKFVRRLNIVYVNIYAAFGDTLYRLFFYIFDAYDKTWKTYPLNVLFITMICFNSYKVASYFAGKGRMQSLLLFQLAFQYVFNIIIVSMTFYIVVPMFVNLSPTQQLIVASASPILGSIAKVISRLSVQSMENITHPGNLYIISLGTYFTAAITYRTFQADIGSNLYFLLICFFHSFVGLLERLSVILRDHFYIWFYKRVLKREIVNSRIGSFRTPRTQRYISDLILCHMMHEVIILLYCNALHQLYQLQFDSRSNVLYNFLLRCFIGIITEYFFGLLSIFVLTWYLNIPVITLWRRKWKSYVTTNFITGMIIIGYTTHHLVDIIQAKYSPTNLTEGGKSCNASRLLFFNGATLQ